MKQELIKTENGINYIKFNVSLTKRFTKLLWLIPNIFIPNFWDGEKVVYDSLEGIWHSFVWDLDIIVFGNWIGCQPSQPIMEGQ